MFNNYRMLSINFIELYQKLVGFLFLHIIIYVILIVFFFFFFFEGCLP